MAEPAVGGAHALAAPNLPGGCGAEAQLAVAGVVAALGHTDATYEQTR